MVELGSERGKDALDAAAEYKEEQGFRSSVDSEPVNDTPIVFVPSSNIRVITPTFLSISCFIEAMVQVTVNPNTPLYPCIVLMVLGEFEIRG